MEKNTSTESNPALAHLGILVCDWVMELSNAAFLPNPSDDGAKWEHDFDVTYIRKRKA